MKSQRKKTGASPQGPQIGHLDSLSGILKEMGNVYREMRFGHTAISDGTRLIYSLKCMRDVLETITLEHLHERLERLEHPLPSRPEEQRQGIALQ